MVAVNSAQTLSQLQADIAEMQTAILYYENRILRKRIAIEEIVQSAAARKEKASPLTVGQMVETVLKDEPSGEYTKVRSICLDRWPADALRIKQNIRVACQRLIKDGLPIVLPKGPMKREHRNGHAAVTLACLLMLCMVNMVRAASVTLEWTPSTTPGATYSLYKSSGTMPFSLILSGLVTNRVTDTGVSTNEPSRWYVTASKTTTFDPTNSFTLESGPSNVVTNTPTVTTNPPPITVPPASPAITSLNRINGNRIDVIWATADLTSQSQVWRSQEGSSFRLVAVVAAGTLHWSDNNAQQRKEFSYQIKSCNQYGCSPPSSTATYPAK